MEVVPILVLASKNFAVAITREGGRDLKIFKTAGKFGVAIVSGMVLYGTILATLMAMYGLMKGADMMPDR